MTSRNYNFPSFYPLHICRTNSATAVVLRSLRVSQSHHSHVIGCRHLQPISTMLKAKSKSTEKSKFV